MKMKKINDKVEELIDILNNDRRVKRLKVLKKELNKDEELISKIEYLKKLDQYSVDYRNLKKELFQNPKFVEYKELENEISIIILEINRKLKNLTNERSCHHENN